MQTQAPITQPVDLVEITLLEQRLRAQAQAAAAKAIGRAIVRLFAKVRQGFSSTPKTGDLRSA